MTTRSRTETSGVVSEYLVVDFASRARAEKERLRKGRDYGGGPTIHWRPRSSSGASRTWATLVFGISS